MRFTRILRAIAPKEGFPMMRYRQRGPSSAYLGEAYGMYLEPGLCPALMRWEHAKEGAIDYVEMDGFNQCVFLTVGIAMVLFYFGLKSFSDQRLRLRGIDPDIVRSQHNYIYGGNGWLARQQARAKPMTFDFSSALRGKWGNDGDNR